MTPPKVLHGILFALAALIPVLLSGTARDASAMEAVPVVVELFTSQGCNTCPPADAYLGELAERKDLVALSFHVDYWDYIGWKDPFAIADATARQRQYSQRLGKGFVYTPQMVIDGAAEAVGSHRATVARAIEKARGAHGKVPVGIVYRERDHVMEISLPAGRHNGPPASVWLVLFDRTHTTDIRKGENTGKRLTYHNVVRDFRRIGSWSGKPARFEVAMKDDGAEERDGCAVLVQLDASGRIIGAGKLVWAAHR